MPLGPGVAEQERKCFGALERLVVQADHKD